MSSISATTSNRVFGLPPSLFAFRFGRETHEAGGTWRVDWQLKRNCSMAPRHLLGFYLGLCTLSLLIASFFWWHGARLVMPFAWLELAAVGACMLAYARHATDHESIALLPGRLTVALASGTRLTRVEFQPEWVKVEPQTADRSLIELSGQGRRISVGRFVRPELRAQLAGELRRAVRLAQGRPPAAGVVPVAPAPRTQN